MIDCGRAHHWLVPTPAGPTSLGTCKKCGATREFLNWEADSHCYVITSEKRRRAATAKTKCPKCMTELRKTGLRAHRKVCAV